ncbi:hypothetical protein CUT44_18885 [Streptomyces carminius]|uniref:Uncharacterized protein n=1 Tax=Streptomyces carminius TaxID=2665496 RepID=A0A2M8LWD8_9ACTN|nr:hypothetical protein [Streptomyces carminius]PJE96219.1 hypothetical protein CUT44_18885 [Streptomyces carminius]
MKTTMIMRNVANPQRTTLVHLENADELTPVPQVERAGAQDAEAALPPQTANPRRTVLVDAPAG